MSGFLREDRKKALTAFREVESIIMGSHFVYTHGGHGSAYVNKDRVYVYPVIVERLCRMIAKAFVNDNIQVIAGPTVGGVSLAHLTTIAMYRRSGRLVQAVFADEEEVFEKIVLEEAEIGNDEEFIRQMLGEDVLREVGDGYEINFTGYRDVVMRISDATGFRNIQLTKKIGTRRILKRGYDAIVQGKRVLLVEDIVNTGSTVVKLREAVERAGGEVVGLAALCNRSGGKVTAETLGMPVFHSLLNVQMDVYPENDCPLCREHGIESVRQDLGKGRDFLTKIGRSDLLI